MLSRAAFAHAEFARAEVEKVPVERLTRNLEEVAKKNPKGAQAVVNLARLHAMAFSPRAEDVAAPPRSGFRSGDARCDMRVTGAKAASRRCNFW